MPQAIAFAVEMESVVVEVLRIREPGGIEENGEGVEVGPLGVGIDDLMDPVIGLALGFEVLEAAGACLDGEIGATGVGKPFTDAAPEFVEVGEDLFGGFAGGDVVVAFVDDDDGGIVGGDQGVEVFEQV